jgi:hypothetical protein
VAKKAFTEIPGALQPRPLRQGERPEVGVPDTPRAGALGFSGMGLAVPECAHSFRALRRRVGQAPQEANRLGAADAAVGKALVARA